MTDTPSGPTVVSLGNGTYQVSLSMQVHGVKALAAALDVLAPLFPRQPGSVPQGSPAAASSGNALPPKGTLAQVRTPCFSGQLPQPDARGRMPVEPFLRLIARRPGGSGLTTPALLVPQVMSEGWTHQSKTPEGSVRKALEKALDRNESWVRRARPAGRQKRYVLEEESP